MVQNAVKELQLNGEAEPETAEPALTKAQRRQIIDDALGQLLVLIRQNARATTSSSNKVEALHRQIHTLFPTSKARR